MDKINPGKINYILYARKSSEANEKQVASTGDQIKVMRAAIEAEDSDFNIIETFEEEKSGFVPYKRKYFNRMIEMLRENKAQGIITWKMSRLSRNPEESGIIMGMLQRKEIQHIYTSDRSYAPGDNTIISAFEFAMSNQSSIETSKDTRRGLNQKAERGWSPRSVLPIGYKHVPYIDVGNDPEILPDIEYFSVVQEAIKSIITIKREPREALQWLKENGIKLKKTATKPQRDLSYSTFYRLLRDEFLVGKFTFNGKTYKGKHKPMLSEAEFQKLQNVVGRSDRKRPQKKLFPFTGLMKCGECGCSITAEETRKRLADGSKKVYIHYHCTKKRGKCSQKTITPTLLEEQFLELLSKVEIPDSFHEWAIEQLKKQSQVEVQERTKTNVRNQKLLDDLEKKINSLLDMRLNDLIDDLEFKNKRAQFEEESKQLQKLVENNSSRQLEWIDIVDNAMDFASKARNEFETGDSFRKKEVIFGIGSNFVLKDREVSLDLHSPFKLISDIKPAIDKAKSRLELENHHIQKEDWCKEQEVNLTWGG